MQYTEDLKGRCVSCGFLAKHTLPGSAPETYFEVEMAEREAGAVFSHNIVFQGPERTTLACFRNAAVLGPEVESALKSDESAGRQAAAQQVILKDRGCAYWFPYQPGLDPKEHLGGKAMQDVEERRNRFEEAMEERRREFEQRMEQERREFERGLESERRKFNFFLTVLVVLVSLAGVVAAILGIFLG